MLEGRRSLREYRPSSDSSSQESFCTLRVTTAVTRWQRRFHSNQRAGYLNLELPTPALLDLPGTPPPPTLYPQPTRPSILSPSWLDEPTPSLITQEPHLPFPQGNNIVVMLHQLNEAGEGLLQSFFLIIPSFFSFILIAYLLGEEDAVTPILLSFSFAPHLLSVSLTFLWT